MYFKIENKESDIYKKMVQQREYELQVEEENRNKLKEIIPFKWDKYLGTFGQSGFSRVSTFSGFIPVNEKEVDWKVWQKDKDNPNAVIPNRRTQKGRELRDKMARELKGVSIFKLFDLLKLNYPNGRFRIPYMNVKDGIVYLYLDERYRPKDDNVIEITSMEFNKSLDFSED